MIMTELSPLSLRRQSSKRKKVQFNRMTESHHSVSQKNSNNELVHDRICEDNVVQPSRSTSYWKPNEDADVNVKQPINTDTKQFDDLFERSKTFISLLPSQHARCYSSCSPMQLSESVPPLDCAKSQPHLICSSSYSPAMRLSPDRRQSYASSSSSKSQLSNSSQMKKKHFSLIHAAQTLLQSGNSPSEQLEPLARSCSYKRPQSIKKYRQQKRGREKEQKEYSVSPTSSTHKYNMQNNNVSRTVISDSARKSISSATSRVSAIDLMANDDQWSSPKANRSTRIGSLPLDQLQIPQDGDQEIYLVRQFNTTSKGFVNRGDSFKRSFKRSGSNSRRSSFKKLDRTPSQEHINDLNGLTNTEFKASSHSLIQSSSSPAGPNLNAILDGHFANNPIENVTVTDQLVDDDDDDHPVVERVETEDGVVQDIRVYQVYLLGMSGVGKCSLMRQFKTTEYRGIYEYSSSVEDDPDNTVSIMLDGIESRLHIINIDVDLIKCSVTGDAYVVVYSITDRSSFQAAVQLLKNIREKESSAIKRYVPIILVGNKSDLVRKRAVTKETARHAAFRYDCKFVETSAAINDKVDDLLAGTLKQIRISEQQRRRSIVTNGDDPIESNSPRRGSIVLSRGSKNIFTKFFNVFRKKPMKLPADVENLNTGIR